MNCDSCARRKAEVRLDVGRPGKGRRPEYVYGCICRSCLQRVFRTLKWFLPLALVEDLRAGRLEEDGDDT